jgi:redox-sensitive bicupin YhaK (pirin superfamily)
MFGISFLTASGSLQRSRVATPLEVRRIALLRSGRRNGSITRFITPWDVGELTRPFLFLGYSERASGPQLLLGAPPPSGIATLTLVLSGAMTFQDTSAAGGMLTAGGYQWITRGEQESHAGGQVGGSRLRAFQLWLGLPLSRGNSPAESQRVAAHQVQEEGTVRVILGQFGQARSRLVGAPPDVNYFHVRLKEGQHWRYAAPEGHNVTWLAVDRGALTLREGERVHQEQLAVFGDSPGAIEVRAADNTAFVLGSARRSSQPLVLDGECSTDTTLASREEIPRVGRRPRVQHRR